MDIYLCCNKAKLNYVTPTVHLYAQFYIKLKVYVFIGSFNKLKLYTCQLRLKYNMNGDTEINKTTFEYLSL